MYDALILGAGVVGINTAYWLARTGRKVAVFDRQTGPAMGASMANGGQISVSHAEPWATPSAPLQVLKWLVREDAPLKFSPRLDYHQWRWIAEWLYQCLPSNTRHNMQEIINLATFSRRLLQEVRSEHQLNYHQQTHGILHFYSNPDTWSKVPRTARLMRDFGCDRNVISKEEALALEPALNNIADTLCGATYTSGDESGDANLYCQEMVLVCRKLGVDFHFNCHIEAITQRFREAGVTIQNDYMHEELYAPSIIVSLGCWSAPLLRPLGINLNIYPAKGYSLTIPLTNPSAAPSISLTDDEYKIVYTRLGDTLRVAGTAELSGYSDTIPPERILPLLERTRHCFPDACNFDDISPWCGLRPATPPNLPYIGPAPGFSNLWLNTGHGTLGWTMSCGSGKILADMIINPDRAGQSLMHRHFGHSAADTLP